jgi:HK97 family phage major capsid protein
MGVGIECDANVAMSQALTHYLRMNALLEHKAGVCVTQIMESYAGNACPSKFRKGASFLVHSLTELELRKLRWKDAAGTYEGGFLWQPSVILGKPNTFLGYPIHTQDDMGTLAGTEGVIAAFGNFKAGYRILDHTSNMSVQRLVELYAEAGLVGFKVHKRVGGYCIRPANKSIILLTEHA